MFSILSFFITALIVVLIIHFLIKHYLLYLPSPNQNQTTSSRKKQVRFNLQPEINNYQEEEQIRLDTDQYLRPINSRHLEMEEEETSDELLTGSEIDYSKETKNVKSELLQFVKDYDKTSHIPCQPLGCQPNHNDGDDLSQFFQISNNHKYLFTEAPTCQNDQVLDELPAKLDKFSKDPVFSEETSTELVLTKDRWKYANEKIMNGGEKDGIQAYDNFNSGENFAMFK